VLDERLWLRRIVLIAGPQLQVLQKKVEYVPFMRYRVEKEVVEVDKSEIAPVAYLKIRGIQLSDK
jgi:hypothetical protein